MDFRISPRRISLGAVFLCSVALGGNSSTVAVPNANATVTGNDTSGPLVGAFSARIQTVINPGQLPTGPILITGFTFRAAPNTGAINLIATGNFYLSTSPNWANSTGHPLMSTTFASNVGSDNTMVLSANNLAINGPGCTGAGPCPFANNIAFTTPFPYNSANGPLLIDSQLTSFGGPGPGQFDVIDCPNTSCAINSSFAALGSTTGSLNGGSSITQVTYVPAASAGSTTNVTLNLTQTSQTHTVPYLSTFAETGSVGALGNATLYVTSNVTITNQAVVVPPIPITATLYFDQLDSIVASFSETDVNFGTEASFTLSGGTITGGTGAYVGATGSLSLTFNQNATNHSVYTTTGSGSVALEGKTTPLTLTGFSGSGGVCTACSLEYNNVAYTGTASPLGNATVTSTIDVTGSTKVLFGTVNLTSPDSFNVFSTNPANDFGDSETLTVAGGTGAYAGATGSFSVIVGQNSAGAITVQGTGTLTPATAGAPIITSVKTAFGAPVVAYDTWLQINGTNLAPANTPAAGVVWSTAPSFAQALMPTQLGPITVTVDGLPAYIFFYCSATTDTACTAGDQINVLAPLDTASAQYPVEVVVTNNGVSSAPYTVLNNGLSPTFPLFDATGHVVARHLDTSFLGPTSLGFATPAKAGETIVLVLYGLGAPTGAPPSVGSATQSGSLPSTPQCWISGRPAAVVGVALISPGLYQLNLTVPTQTTTGDNPISCSYQGYPTFPGTLIAVQ